MAVAAEEAMKVGQALGAVSYGLAIQHEIQWGARAMPAVMATNSADQSLARFCVADRFARLGLVKLAEFADTADRAAGGISCAFGNRRARGALSYIAARSLPPAGSPLLQPPSGAVFFWVVRTAGPSSPACDGQKADRGPALSTYRPKIKPELRFAAQDEPIPIVEPPPAINENGAARRQPTQSRALAIEKLLNSAAKRRLRGLSRQGSQTSKSRERPASQRGRRRSTSTRLTKSSASQTAQGSPCSCSAQTLARGVKDSDEAPGPSSTGQFQTALTQPNRSRGGRTTKIYALTDELCRPIAFMLTSGHMADSTAGAQLRNGCRLAASSWRQGLRHPRDPPPDRGDRRKVVPQGVV